MNRSTTTPRSLSADQLRTALGDVGGPARADYLTDIVDVAGRTRQRPGWMILDGRVPWAIAPRREGVPRGVVVFAALLLLALVVAASVYVGSRPTRTVDLGIFEPAAGRIVFGSRLWSAGRGFEPGLWAVDPISPSVSTLVRIGAEGDYPIGWSSDGTKLLVQRKASAGQDLCCRDYLVMIHADGTETLMNGDAVYLYGATIAPDGSRVVFGAGDYRGTDVALFAVDADGGEPVRIAGEGQAPTFSPDGTQLAYLVNGPSGARVVVANADGSDAREILAGEQAVRGGNELAWSPAGDRIAIGVALAEDSNAIYSFRPDGSDFKRVVSSGLHPFWSADGSRIAYSIWDDPSGDGPLRLAIADADGSNAREFDFGASGPWHPVMVESAGVRPVGAP